MNHKEQFEKAEKGQVYFDEFYRQYKGIGIRLLKRIPGRFKHYDCRISYRGKLVTIEEKARFVDKGSLLVEHWQCVKRRNKGWGQYSKADYLVYGIFVGKPLRIYIIPMRKLQEVYQVWLEKGDRRLRRCSYLVKEGWGDTQNYFIEFEDLKREVGYRKFVRRENKWYEIT